MAIHGIWQGTARDGERIVGEHRLLHQPFAGDRDAPAIILHDDEAKGFVGC